jgi:signal transduction histidine kinase/DNA-binding NarL/FixJ family response regulator
VPNDPISPSRSIRQLPRRSLAHKFFVFTAILVFWVVATIIAYDFSKENFDGAKAALLCTVVFLVAGAISRFTLRVLVKPLTMLQEGITSVGEGKLEPIRVSHTEDEIEFLGQNFNRMITALAESRQEVRQHQELLEVKIKQRTEALEEAVQRATSASQAKSEFLANISHELRTPMGGVLGMMDIVLDSRLTPEQREQLETAQRCAHSLLALLNDILDLSKIEAGKMALEKIPFDLRNLLDDCIKSHLPRARQKGIAIVSDLDPALPRQVIGDPLRLRQILANLLSNAIKFTDRGLVKASVTGRMAPETGKLMLELAVSDTGVGIEPDKLAIIFEKFTQADGSVTRRYGGTGLGLTITRRLAEMHHGNIRVESEPGAGSTFYVTLECDPAKAIVPSGAEGPAVDASAPVPAGQAEKPLILVVEDNQVNQKVIGTILRKRGYRVRIAVHGGEAMEALTQDPIALVLMDIQMPVLDGIETTRLIRQEERWAALPILAMTAHVMQGDREECLEAGMDGYISKPVNPSHLVSMIETHLAAAPKHSAYSAVADGHKELIDHRLAAKSLDISPQLLKGMLDLFLQIAPERMHKLHSAVRQHEWECAVKEAREMKRAAERIAATSIVKCASEIEVSTISRNLVAASESMARLDAELVRLSCHRHPMDSVTVN